MVKLFVHSPIRLHGVVDRNNNFKQGKTTKCESQSENMANMAHDSNVCSFLRIRLSHTESIPKNLKGA
jgi:hypothetical protein